VNDPIPVGSRVSLKDGMERVYTFAVAGTEGWVRERKEDSDGFPLVRIEWDKEHWRYNGQPDGWTFEDHFRLIDVPAPTPEVEPEPAEGLLAQLQPDERAWGAVDGYVDDLSDAMDAASEGEGFFMIVIRQRQNDKDPNEVMYFPTIFDNALTEEARCVLDAQLAECASTNYQFMVASLMEALARRKRSE
jgi:hypothetical protein